MSTSSRIIIGTRASALALWQAHWVAARLQQAGWETELVTMETKGDKILGQSLASIGSKGLFTEELEEKLLNHSIDIAVHSAKDMPSELPSNLELIAFTERESAQDVLVSHKENIRLEQKQPLVIGTSSVRRKALLQRYFPQHTLVDIRGNLQTRFKKMEEGQCDAMLLAFAGVHRMELGSYIRQHLHVEVFVPPVGQGSLAIEASNELSPEKKQAIQKVLNHFPSAQCVLAERHFLRTIQGGCSVPAFAHARILEGTLTLDAGIISLDGDKLIQQRMHLNDPQQLGQNLAKALLEQGGSKILSEIKNQK
ncbi:MAG: hydroxymethylbilane synthase [Cytophagaceae bacterium]|jgi:hydroxymethylbilane synthase|nr:hydroxymethylbilane synthase [Cytophagaceae bacterium]